MRALRLPVAALLAMFATSTLSAQPRDTNATLTAVTGIKVGHFTLPERPTGCTVVLAEAGATTAVDVRGAAPATRETDLLDPVNTVQIAHAVVLAGGSAFGLDTASGVMRYLEEKKIGFAFGPARVPIVPAAALFDLPIGDGLIRPGADCGYRAAAAASNAPVTEGSVGAGAGATIGKAAGAAHAMKAGIGSASVTLPGGLVVAALVAVNAYGDVVDPAGGKIVAGARKSPDSREFVDSAAALRHGIPETRPFRGNTTLAIVATNAALDKVQTNKLAALGSLGVVRTISPVNTMADGDITFAISLGSGRASVDAVGSAAAEVLAQAVLRAVRAAKSAAGVPGLAS